MTLQFTKRYREKYLHPTHGHFESCVVYTIYLKENILGTFILSEKVGFIDYEETALRIEIAHHTFKSDKYEIIDNKTGVGIGEYKIPLLMGEIQTPGTLVLEKKEYTCKKMKPAIPYSLFKRKTWGYYKIKVSDEKEEAIYTLKLNVPIFEVANTSERPFDGEVQTNTINLKLVFCGLLLLEQMLTIRDNRMTPS